MSCKHGADREDCDLCLMEYAFSLGKVGGECMGSPKCKNVLGEDAKESTFTGLLQCPDCHEYETQQIASLKENPLIIS